MKTKPKEIITDNLDIKQIVGYYNLYANPDPWWEGERNDFRLECLSLVRKQLSKRGILPETFPTLPKLDSIILAPGLVVATDPKENKFIFLKDSYKLDEDLFSSLDVINFVSQSPNDLDLYSALCNVTWEKGGIRWSCSWRYAGGVVARIKEFIDDTISMDYLAYYCSGNEGAINEKVAELLLTLGWKPILFEEE